MLGWDKLSRLLVKPRAWLSFLFIGLTSIFLPFMIPAQSLQVLARGFGFSKTQMHD